MELTACAVYGCVEYSYTVYLISFVLPINDTNVCGLCFYIYFKNLIKLQFILVAGKDIVQNIYQVVLNFDPQVTSANT